MFAATAACTASRKSFSVKAGMHPIARSVIRATFPGAERCALSVLTLKRLQSLETGLPAMQSCSSDVNLHILVRTSSLSLPSYNLSPQSCSQAGTRSPGSASRVLTPTF